MSFARGSNSWVELAGFYPRRGAGRGNGTRRRLCAGSAARGTRPLYSDEWDGRRTRSFSRRCDPKLTALRTGSIRRAVPMPTTGGGERAIREEMGGKLGLACREIPDLRLGGDGCALRGDRSEARGGGC